eukprot:TRINITY_DN235_c0_g1_i1.p1 TRINITY_DN235_c0_g1~~TRINITY_DN235_c0_g1_i1.p1  ORF type:complete len:156 (-),score=51.08 TRINITY_DN235_c0_g1_i1:430-897(-)
MADSANSSESNRCLGGCGFFGHPNTKGYCSLCYSELQKKNNGDVSAEVIDSVLSGAVAEAPAVEREGEAVAATSAEAEDVEKPKKKKVQKNKGRCWECKKKVGLLGYTCKCEYVFCANHRMAEQHTCDFDFKTDGKELLANKLGEACVAEKVSKI